ncbi:hypothetical protein OQA88_12323 [Cercophora sp. LCS_1]
MAHLPAMPPGEPTVVDLGSIQVTGGGSGELGLSVVLSSSFSVILPPSWKGSATATELHRASQAGEIWITKDYSVLIEVLTLVEGKVFEVDDSGWHVTPAIVGLTGKSKVWEDVGLVFKTKHSPADSDAKGRRPQASYFLHHVVHPGDATPPSGIPVAHFQSLRLEIDFRAASPKRTPGKMPKENTRPAQPMAQPPRTHRYSLRQAPRQAKKVIEAEDDYDSESERTKPVAANSDTRSELAAFDEVNLLDAGLRRLLGVRGGLVGMKTKWGTFPSLIDIAPGVWNPSYLRSLANRTKTITAIANGMARLRNARSPSLQEKIQKFASLEYSHSEHAKGAREVEGVKGTVRKKLWVLCQTGIRAKAIRKPRTRKPFALPQGDSETKDDTSQIKGLGGEGHHKLAAPLQHHIPRFASDFSPDFGSNPDFTFNFEWHYPLPTDFINPPIQVPLPSLAAPFDSGPFEEVTVVPWVAESTMDTLGEMSSDYFTRGLMAHIEDALDETGEDLIYIEPGVGFEGEWMDEEQDEYLLYLNGYGNGYIIE